MENKRIFITGGVGFIGSILGRHLSQNNEILAFDNFTRDAFVAQEQLLNETNVKIIKGDILDEALLLKTISEFQPTHIVHCAAIAGIDSVVKKPTNTLRVNILGTANLLNAIKTSGLQCERIVLFSTSEIFGSNAFNSCETHNAVIGAVGEARWTYAVSKLADEHLGLAYHKEFGFPCTVVRPFNVYGPGQIGEGALSAFIKAAICNDPIYIHGDGNQIRSWCYVNDMLSGLILLLNEDSAIGESFNIGNPRSVVTIYGLAQTVCRVLNSKSKIIFSKRQSADIELRIPDIKKAETLLGFKPLVDLEQGIIKTATFYKSMIEAYKLDTV